MRVLARGAVLAMLALACGCREARSVRWEIVIDAPMLRARALSVAAEVRRGTCLEHGELVYGVELGLSDVAPPLPTLGGGVHAFAARARDASCVEIAAGCTDLVLPTEPDRLVRTIALASTGMASDCSACVEGRCAASDAGVR